MNPDQIKDYADSLLSESQNHLHKWETLRKLIMPSTLPMSRLETTPQDTLKIKFSAVANLACLQLASAHVTYVINPSERWYMLASHESDASETINSWYNKATEISHQELGRSNFYTCIHTVCTERSLTGIGLIYCDWNESEQKLQFQSIPTGTYAIDENHSGIVDTVVRKFKLTPKQAEQQFGLDALPEKIQEALNDPKKKSTQHNTYIHVVTPRTEYDPSSLLAPSIRQKYASYYFLWEENKPLIHESGYYEFPYTCTRFLHLGDKYGYATGESVLSDIKKTINMDDALQTLGERSAFPAVLELAEQVGEIDLRAGGRTVISRVAAQLGYPKEWATAGRYDIGIDINERRESKIKDAFFISMLNVISGVDRQMTATEVRARQEEQFLSFSPSFTLLTSELNVLITRIFGLLFRAGKLPNNTEYQEYPPELIVPDADGSENYQITTPSVTYLGRIPQAIAITQRSGLETYLQLAIAVTQATGSTAWLDSLKLQEAGIWAYSILGGPQKCLNSPDELAEINRQKEAEVERMKKFQEMEAMKTLADANQSQAKADATQASF